MNTFAKNVIRRVELEHQVAYIQSKYLINTTEKRASSLSYGIQVDENRWSNRANVCKQIKLITLMSLYDTKVVIYLGD